MTKSSLKLPQKLMLLGSGELGKEFAIAAKRLGNHLIAVDRYVNAPAMQVADAWAVDFNAEWRRLGKSC